MHVYVDILVRFCVVHLLVGNLEGYRGIVLDYLVDRLFVLSVVVSVVAVVSIVILFVGQEIKSVFSSFRLDTRT